MDLQRRAHGFLRAAFDDKLDPLGSYQKLIEDAGFSLFCVTLAGSDRRTDILAHSDNCAWFDIWLRQYLKLEPTADVIASKVGLFSLPDEPSDGSSEIVDLFLRLKQNRISIGWTASIKVGGGRCIKLLLLGTSMEKTITACGHEHLTALHLASVYYGLFLMQKKSSPDHSHRPLTRREVECMRWVAAGKTDWEVSRILGISEKTVQEHVGHAITKLQANTRAHAVAKAYSANVLTYD